MIAHVRAGTLAPIRTARRRAHDDKREEDEREQPATASAPVEAVLRAQRAYGNQAVANVLARDAHAAPRKPPPPRPAKQPLREGREIDAIFDASPYFHELVAAKLKKTSVQKAMQIDDDATFERAWIAYALRSYNPRTKQNWTEADAKDYLAKEGVRAFQDEDRGEIHIRKERADLGTQLHEALHLFSSDKWKRKMEYNANEGVTEYFTRKLGPEVGVERDDGSFLKQYTSVTHLVDTAGEPAVRSAYFEGEIGGLQTAVDAKEKGTFRKWVDLLESNDFKGANALMKGAAPPKPD